MTDANRGAAADRYIYDYRGLVGDTATIWMLRYNIARPYAVTLSLIDTTQDESAP